jgi:two-component system, chemotaxis family, CheB/CheR fusion protein
MTPPDKGKKSHRPGAERPHKASSTNPLRRLGGSPPPPKIRGAGGSAPETIRRKADQIVLDAHSPGGVLIDGDMNVLQFRGRTGPYLAQPDGAGTSNLLRLARGRLASELRDLVLRAKQTGAAQRREGVRFEDDLGGRAIDLEVVPVQVTGVAGSWFLVLFGDDPRPSDLGAGTAASRPDSVAAHPDGSRPLPPGSDEHVFAAFRNMNLKLDQTNREMRAAQEELQTSNQDLTALNDELQRRNEELQRVIVERERVERNLRGSEERNRLIAGMTSHFTASSRVSEDGTITVESLTEGFTALTGYALEEIHGPRGWLALVHPDDQTEVRESLARVLDNQPQTSEFRILTKHCEIRWIRHLAHPVRDLDESRVVRIYSAAEDITARRREEEAKTLLAAVVESSDDAILSQTLDGTILSWNAAAERMYGYRAKEALGKSVAMLIPAGRAHEHSDLLDNIREGKQIRRLETVHVRMDGREIDVSLSIAPLRSSSGQILGASTIARDITERKRVERALRLSEERFRQLAGNLDSVFWMTERSPFRMLYVSPAYREVWGRSLRSLYEEPMSFLEAIHPEDRDKVIEALERQKQGEATILEYRVLRPDGSMRWVLNREFPIPDPAGEIRRVAGIVLDITDRRRAEEALRQADRRKDEFLGVLAHELRNPLSVISGASQVLDRIGEGEPQAAKMRAMIARQSAILSRMVDDLLNVSRFSRGSIVLKKESLHLAAVADAVAASTRSLLKERGHELIVDVPAPIWLEADPVRLEQILVNLLTNAAKYTQPGGRIWLQATTEPAEGKPERVVLSVRDTGIGIPPEMLPRVFDVFTQVDTAIGRAQAGLGIGLYLVQKLVKSHGGEVSAHSEGTGRGSEFTVRLPIGSPRAAASQDEIGGDHRPGAPAIAVGGAAKAASSPGVRVLVVDDIVDLAESTVMLLGIMGYEAHMVHDGRAAIEAALRIRPHIMFLDIGMPSMNGYEVAERLRREQDLKGMLMVAMTGYGTDEHHQRARAAGFDHHLVKPVTAETLQAVLRNARIPRGPA